MRTSIVILLVACVWLVLLPPFFTHGECGAEFAAATRAAHAARAALGTLELAQAYLSAKALPYQLVTAERCDYWPGVDACSGGPVLLVSLPVKNRVCRYYRDSSVHLQLGFNSVQQLVRLETDMKPPHVLKLPLLNIELDWAG